MRKLFLAMFGGSPARAEICMYLNAAAGIYQDCDIRCYPIDKDTESPNYIKARDFYLQYREFRKIAVGSELAGVEIQRTEPLFDEMLKNANIAPQQESIRYALAAHKGMRGEDGQLLDICYTYAEQEDKLAGGYYGKANMGAVINDIFVREKVYEKLDIYKDIQTVLSGKNSLDVVIICSSFGGTGASLGINFGEYLYDKFKEDENFHLHCIHIQPYFYFPDPIFIQDGGGQREKQIDYKQFYAKSAAVTSVLGEREDLIKKDTKEAVFDRFYYIGQEVLDKVSERNSAAGGQDNNIHIIDMLVSLAVQDILREKQNKGTQLYGYLYSNDGTSYISWQQMPRAIGFQTKHACMMRFCEFMLDCMMPLFQENDGNYKTEALIVHLFGTKGFFKNEADIREEINNKLRDDMRVCCDFCRSYMQYWIELEENTRYGDDGEGVTRFFNLEELKRIVNAPKSDYKAVWEKTDNLELTRMTEYKNYEKGDTCCDIYALLCREKELKEIARRDKIGMNVAGALIRKIYEKCAVEDYDTRLD